MLPFAPETNSIIVTVFLRGAGSKPFIEKQASVNLRKYKALGNLPGSCEEVFPPSHLTMQRLSDYINGASSEKPRDTLKLKAGANAIPAQWLEPGAQYRLTLRYNLGNRTVGRVEVVNRGKLIAKQLYFKPSSDVEIFDFHVPHDLGDQLIVHLSTSRGSNVQYSDISITKK